MNTPELLQKVRKIEIKTRGLSRRLFSGEYHSAFKGRGMSFAEVRPYQYGDDVRFIDWNVTARYNDAYVKIFEEERELMVILLIDLSRSDNFGSVSVPKSELMTEIAAVLSFSAIANNDKVGVIFFTDRVEKFIPPRKGRTHILRIIRELINFIPEGSGTDIGLALHYLSRVIRRRCIAFMLSDFIDDRNYEPQLKVAAAKHDLIGMNIYDPLEMHLPKAGLLHIRDAESGKMIWVDTSDRQLRNEYNRRQRLHYAQFSSTFSRNGADTLHIRTDEDYMPALHRFFRKREERR